jgi:tetratricopeptide (TPR) repeat protein
LKNIYNIAISFFAFLILLGCSTKKDAFLNRNFQALNTKYNVLYNGNEALRVGLEDLNSNYEDNYWERLPIEPLKVDKLALPGVVMDPDGSPKDFEKAEEKAVKAIQRRSMLIARQERNKQIDDAYLLLGKSRYYSKRFVPALEAFNYIILNYPNASLMQETIIWQSKTQIRLQNEEQAIQNLGLLIKHNTLEKENREEAHTTLAMAYLETDSIQLVIHHLNQAVLTDYNQEQRARNLFILGQLYRENSQIDSSNISFQKIVESKKAPYKYKIHAFLEKAKNSTSGEEDVAMIEELNSLIKNRDNRPYLGELYYQAGIIQRSHDTEMAIENFAKSLQASSSSFQKGLSYEAIGNLYFDKAEFLLAGAYYDSILQFTENDNSKRLRSLIRRRNNLDEVIYYENVSKINDSILGIVSMTSEAQNDFFTAHIDKLKAAEVQQQEKLNTGSGFLGSKNRNENNLKGKWYFYNIQTTGFGKQEFEKMWGNRPLEDNWRLSNKTAINLRRNNNISINEPIQIPDSKKYELSYYLDNIPSDKNKIDSIIRERNNAYFKLGVIYKEQFKEENLAMNKLEKLLTFNPGENILLPAKYHLYKIYESRNDSKMTDLRKDIVNNYSDSKYAKIILNPAEFISEEAQDSPENEYSLVYYEYKDEKFDSVIEKSTLAIQKFEGQSIVPKFELLKAYAIGKRDGVLAFKEALDFVVMNYPNTEESKKAMEVMETIKTKI